VKLRDIMKKKHRWTMERVNGVAFGVFAASLFYLILFWCIDIVGEDDKVDTILTIAGWIATLVAGWLAFVAVWNQIQDARDIESENREAAHIAARATLPLALSRLGSVCDNNIRRNYDPADLLYVGTPATKLMECDPESIAILKEVIGATSEANREQLARIIRMYQVVFARSPSADAEPLAKTAEDDPVVDYERNLDALNWAALQAVVNNAFDYSRGRKANIPPDVVAKQVETCLLNAGLDFDEFPNMKKVFELSERSGKLLVID
jgi:hypothetical protein